MRIQLKQTASFPNEWIPQERVMEMYRCGDDDDVCVNGKRISNISLSEKIKFYRSSLSVLE